MTHTSIHPTDHPSERELELFVLGAGSSDEASRVSLREHIAHCAMCAETVDVLGAAHTAALDAHASQPSESIWSALRTLGAASSNTRQTTVVLHPAQRSHALHHSPPPTIALAAQDEIVKPRYVALQTLCTGDESTLLRILADNSAHGTILQIVSDFEEYMSEVVVEFGGGRGLFRTDAQGEVRLPHRPPSDFSGCMALVHTARAEAHVDAVAPPAQIELSDGTRLQVEAGAQADTLRFTYSAVPDGVKLHVLRVAHEGASDQLVSFTDGAVLLAAEAFARGAHITAY